MRVVLLPLAILCGCNSGGPLLLDPRWQDLQVSVNQTFEPGDGGPYCPSSWQVVVHASSVGRALPDSAEVTLHTQWGWIAEAQNDCSTRPTTPTRVMLDPRGFAVATWCIPMPPSAEVTVTAQSGAVSATSTAPALEGCVAQKDPSVSLALSVNRGIEDLPADGGAYCPRQWHVTVSSSPATAEAVRLETTWGWLVTDGNCQIDFAQRKAAVDVMPDAKGAARATWCFSALPAAEIRLSATLGSTTVSHTEQPLAGCD